MNALEVLLVDDDDSFYDTIHELLAIDANLGNALAITRLRDAADLMDYLQGSGPFEGQDNPWPRCIFLDQRMPRMDGTEALGLLRQNKRTRGLPVCMLSSSGEEKLVKEAYDAGANFYLVKPYELEELQLKLAKVSDFMSTVAQLPIPPTA